MFSLNYFSKIHTWRILTFCLAAFVSTISILATVTIARAAILALPVISVTKSDAIINDGVPLSEAADGKADPGETIEYTVVINNSGPDDATGLTYTDTIDPNITLSGSASVSPVAINDTLPVTVTGNVAISTSLMASPFSVVTNDYPGQNVSPGLTIVGPATFLSAQGGNVSMTLSGANIGQFTYDPPAGFEGTDTFTYTLSDNANASSVAANRTATVTINVSGMIWFVNNNALACTVDGCGRLSNPYSTLAAFSLANNGTGNHPAANDNIFIYESATPYTGGITLLSGQKLIGQDSTQTLSAITGLSPVTGSLTLPVMNATPAQSTTIQNAGGNGVTLNSGNTLNGFTASTASASAISGSGFGTLTAADVIVNTTGQALSLTNGVLSAVFPSVTSTGGTNNVALTGPLTGTLTINAGALSGATGNAFNMNGGSATINNAAAIASGNARSVNVTGLTGGTVTFSGAITDTDTGISLTTNTGATINFIGGLSLSTGSNSAFTATGGGTVNVCDENPCNPGATGALVNTLTTTSGTALNVANTTIGSNNLEFRSISVNGAPKGIILNTTGSSGGLKVVGIATTDGSGGTIQNISSRGGEFISTNNLLLKNMNFTNAATVDGDADNSGLSTGDNLLSNAPIHLQTVTTVTLDNININGSAEQGINGNNVNGFTLSNSTITGAGNGPDEDGLHFYNLSGINFITNTDITSSGDDNVNIQNNTNTASISTLSTINVTNGNFNTGVLGSGLLFGIRGTFNTNVNISGATCNNNFSGGIVIDTYDTATSDLDITGVTSTNNNDGISLSSNNGNTKFDIYNNVSFAGNDFGRINVLKAAFSTGGTLEGRIHNNPIVVSNGQTTDGVSVQNLGAGTLRVLITNNTFDYHGTQRALYIAGGQDGNATVEATVTGNLFDIKLDGTGNAVNAILAQAAVASPSGDPSSLCIDIGGGSNTFTHSLGGTLPGGDIRVRQRFISNVRLPGYVGGGTDVAAAVAYLNSRNTVVSPSTVSITTSISGGAACAQPVLSMGPNNAQILAQSQPEPGAQANLALMPQALSVLGRSSLDAIVRSAVVEAPVIAPVAQASDVNLGGGKPLFALVQPAPALLARPFCRARVPSTASRSPESHSKSRNKIVQPKAKAPAANPPSSPAVRVTVSGPMPLRAKAIANMSKIG